MLLLLFLISTLIQIWGWQCACPQEGQPVPSLGKRLDYETPADVPTPSPLCSIILTSQHQLFPT